MESTLNIQGNNVYCTAHNCVPLLFVHCRVLIAHPLSVSLRLSTLLNIWWQNLRLILPSECHLPFDFNIKLLLIICCLQLDNPCLCWPHMAKTRIHFMITHYIQLYGLNSLSFKGLSDILKLSLSYSTYSYA